VASAIAFAGFAFGFGGAARASDAAEASRIFNQRCTACHTFGKGIKVGPDLKGATERRSRSWLLAFIRGSSQVIAAGDPTATELFSRFNGVRMPDWNDLSPEQVTSILDWFAADGPEHQKPIEARSADEAEAADLETGRKLFAGEARLATGGLPCASCHSLRAGSGGWSLGATLGPDLSRAYFLYGDRALTTYLGHPCFARFPDSTASRYLSAEETFALKAYLRSVALSRRP
jgi:mono/diheme cytochrome c family protein